MLAFGEKSASGAVSCYVEPCFVPSGELEAAVSTNRNVISFVTELTGKESFYGQGAGRYPTAYNAVADWRRHNRRREGILHLARARRSR